MNASIPSEMASSRERAAWGHVRKALGMTLAAVVTALATARSAVSALSGAPKIESVLPLAAVCGTGLIVIATVKFEAFVLVVLFLRSSLDAVKLSGSTFGVDPAGIVAVAFMLAAGLWLVIHPSRGALLSTVGLGFTAFVATSALSVLASSDPTRSLVELSRIVAVLIMLIVLQKLLKSSGSVRRVLVAVYASALLPIAFGIRQLVTGRGTLTIEGFSRVIGTFVHSNPFAMYLVLLLVMGVALWSHVGRGARIALLVLGIAGGACLFGTYTRGAWIAGLAGLLTVAVLEQRRYLLFGLLVSVVAAALFVPSATQRFSDLGAERSLRGQPGNSLTWRLDYWREAVALAEDRRITGVGLGMVAASTDVGKPVHNDFVRAYVETGVLGLLAYVSFLIALVSSARQTLRRRPSGIYRATSVGCAGCVVVFLVLSVSANVISQVAVLWYFVAFVAIGMDTAPAGSGTLGEQPA